MRFVVLAGILSFFACWTAINLLMRARLAEGAMKRAWVFSAAFVFGAGTWGMHFVAMLAYRSTLPLAFDLWNTVLSMVLAIGLSCLGFAMAMLMDLPKLGATVGGLAVAGMHYLGARAIEGPFHIVWDWRYVAASVVIAVGFVVAGAHTALAIRNIRGRLLTAFLWAFGICALHFAGMAAMTLVPDPTVSYGAHILVNSEYIGIAVAALTVLVVGLGLAAAQFDNHLAQRRLGEEARLRGHIFELETTKRNLEKTTRSLNEALLAATAANTAKSDFMAQMSHELRTPLNAILGFSEILRDELYGPMGDRRYRNYVQDIHDSGARLLDLINNILDHVKLHSGGLALQESVFSPRELVAEALNAVREKAAAGGLRLLDETPSGLPVVRAGRRRMYQVIFNILSNAVKFTPSGGTVKVTAGIDARGMYLTISDTGIGIAEEDIPKALEHFSQVDSKLSRKFEGAGLGLPISLELMKAHGGTLEIQSSPGKGTAVTVILPAYRIVAVENAA
ncbi:MAG TPA: MHYT domain-containing protein [Rhizomicrobium sp.]|nr:MHYT domain-containing protein [Rhizomicrobium sp.]